MVEKRLLVFCRTLHGFGFGVKASEPLAGQFNQRVERDFLRLVHLISSFRCPAERLPGGAGAD
jgi:hypothetical protein